MRVSAAGVDGSGRWRRVRQEEWTVGRKVVAGAYTITTTLTVNMSLTTYNNDDTSSSGNRICFVGGGSRIISRCGRLTRVCARGANIRISIRANTSNACSTAVDSRLTGSGTPAVFGVSNFSRFTGCRGCYRPLRSARTCGLLASSNGTCSCAVSNSSFALPCTTR